MRHYISNKKRYISVTSIISLMYPFNRDGFVTWAYSKGLDPQWILDESHRIGNMVHNWVEDAFLGIKVFDIAPREDEIGYRTAVDRFIDKYMDKFEASEKLVKNEEFRYMGRFDALVAGTIVDFKTWGAWNKTTKIDAAKVRKVKYQTSLYNYALKNKYKQAIVYFKPDGTYDWISLKFSDRPIKWLKENKHVVLEKLQEEPDDLVQE